MSKAGTTIGPSEAQILGAGVTTYDSTIFRNFIEKEFSYIAGFRRNVDRYAHSLAIIDPVTDNTWTYAELGQQVNRRSAQARRTTAHSI